MRITLDYASPRLPRLRLWPIGVVAAVFAVASAAVIIWWSVVLAQRAQLALIVPTDCGTGRHEAADMLMFFVPFALPIPACAWVISRFAGEGQLISRCSVWSAIAGWLMSVAFVVFR